MYHFDRWCNSPLNTLYLFKENCNTNLTQKKQSNYEIVFISNPFALDLSDLYIIYDNSISLSTVKNLIAYYYPKKTLIKLFYNRDDALIFNDIKSKFQGISFLEIENILSETNSQQKRISLFRNKPVLVMLSCDIFNQQISLELGLEEIFDKYGVRYHTISLNPDRLQNYSTMRNKIDDINGSLYKLFLEESMKQDYKEADIIIISLPFNLCAEDINCDEIRKLLSSLCPDYIITCISNRLENDFPMQCYNIIKYRFGYKTNSFFVSPYINNPYRNSYGALYYDLHHIKSSSLFQVFYHDEIKDLYKHILEQLTYPEDITPIACYEQWKRERRNI